ncbi:MAG: hypothetical protein R2764_19605 [Bacteroidales bacterium]
MAKSAIRECIVLTSIAEKQNVFGESSVNESREVLMELTKMIGALIVCCNDREPAQETTVIMVETTEGTLIMKWLLKIRPIITVLNYSLNKIF